MLMSPSSSSSMSTATSNVDGAGGVSGSNPNNAVTLQDCLRDILSRYRSGASRIYRLNAFAQYAATAGGGGGGGGGGEDDTTVGVVVREAYQAISDACKEEGTFVQYKIIFGGSGSKLPPSMAMATSDDSMSDAMVMSSPSHQPSAYGTTATTTTTSTTTLSPTVLLGEYDVSWVEEQESLARCSIQVLEHRLQLAQSQLHKESIRTAYLALAVHYCRYGDWMPAFHALLRAKDYCTARPQTCHVCWMLVSVALAMGNTVAAAEYIHKWMHTLRNATTANANANATATTTTAGSTTAASSMASSSSPTTSAGGPHQYNSEWDSILAHTALALERMASGDWAKALPALLMVVQHEEMEAAFAAASSSDPQQQQQQQQQHSQQQQQQSQQQSLQLLPRPPYWVSPQDVSLYAAVLCLSHGTLAQMIALTNHVSALEWVPALRTCLEAFGQAQYPHAWHVVAVQLYTTLAVDPFLGPHLPALLQGIKRKCWQYYWRAYSRVPLAVMAQDLGSSLVSSMEELREEWIALILDYQQKGGNHHHNNNSNNNNSGSTTMTKTITTMDEVALRNTRLNLATDTLHRDKDGGDTNNEEQKDSAPHKMAVLTQQVLDDSYAMMIRLACQEHDLIVFPPHATDPLVGGDYWRPQQQQQQQGGRSRSGGSSRGGAGASSSSRRGDDNRMEDDGDEEDDDDCDAAMSPLDHHNNISSAMNPEDMY